MEKLKINYFKLIQVTHPLPSPKEKFTLNTLHRQESIQLECSRKCLICMQLAYFAFSKTTCYCYGDEHLKLTFFKPKNIISKDTAFFLAIRDRPTSNDKSTVLDLNFKELTKGSTIDNGQIIKDKSSYSNNGKVVCKQENTALEAGVGSIAFSLSNLVQKNNCYLEVQPKSSILTLVNSDFSVEIWYNPTDNNFGGYLMVLEDYFGIRNGNLKTLGEENGPFFYFKNQCGTFYPLDKRPQDYNNKVHHYLATFDASNKVLTQYLDSRQVSRNEVCNEGEIERSTSGLFLGTSENIKSQRDYRGQIYSLRLLKRVIQEDEVKRLSNLYPNQIDIRPEKIALKETLPETDEQPNEQIAS
ncbi:DgyrCDS14299 [Dimorphilus gyrociliatus]|uniref:DgyrCDS14299 n=1 Tax=Dimorphilus gyrociliatus TaxID=2664684 RepID=A0A7I8WD82_9ANNE|nr:DgyrCDS14299 [Dimorphilus gyrociliatus]